MYVQYCNASKQLLDQSILKMLRCKLKFETTSLSINATVN